jgi:uncharacterized membrane protein
MLTDLLARLHPVLVHFPIALLATAWLYEFARRRPASEPRPGVSRACLTLGALGAVAAAVSGWFAGAGSSYARSMPTTLGLHRWVGVSLAACAVACVVLGLLADAKKRVPYRILLTVTLVLVAVGGHLGGTLVHGPGFLTDAFRSRPAASTPPSTTAEDETRRDAADEAARDGREPLLTAAQPTGAQVDDAEDDIANGGADEPPAQPSYARDVAPLLERHCLECHGPDRRKGGLRLDRASLPALRAAEPLPGDPAVLVPGDADASELVRRVELADGDPDRMPDKAPPLSAADRATLRAWVAAGAPLE